MIGIVKRKLQYASISVQSTYIPQKTWSYTVACFKNMEALVCLIDLKQATLKPHAVTYDDTCLTTRHSSDYTITRHVAFTVALPCVNH